MKRPARELWLSIDPTQREHRFGSRVSPKGTKMDTVKVKLPTLEALGKKYPEMKLQSFPKGMQVEFANSYIDMSDLGKEVELYFCVEESGWIVGPSSYTDICSSDLKELYPKRKIAAPKTEVSVGCSTVRITKDCAVQAHGHTLTDKELEDVTELLETRKRLMS